MVMKTISYFTNDKKKKIKVKFCDTPLKKFLGLMFRKKSPPLLFVFNKNKILSIHSFFCRPFKAIWLNEKMQIIKIVDVKTWKPNISGKGKFLLEIPASFKSNKFPSTNMVVDNRKI